MAHHLKGKLLFILLLFCGKLWAQQPSLGTLTKISALPEKFLPLLQKKIGAIERQLLKTSAKALKKLQKQERKLYHALLQQNPEAANTIFAVSIDSLTKRQHMVSHEFTTAEGYHPWVDSMRASLQFLQTDSGARLCAPNAMQQLPLVQAQLQKLQGQLTNATNVQAMIADRQQLIQQHFLQYPSLQKLLGQYAKQAYYYKAKLAEYKSLLSNRKKAEAAAFQLLHKIPAFKKFLQKHSYMGNLFSPPVGNAGSYGQTNSYVATLINSIGPGAMQQIRDNVQAGQNQLEQLKNKLGFKGGSSEDIPSFKPNEMRNKSFFKRLKLGTNYQFTAARGTAPQMLDLGFQVAYQFSKNKQAGIGLGYRLGMGKNFRQIAFSNEGLGLRSFFDARIKGGIYASGGFEWQYSTRFYSLRQLQQSGNWSRLALAGISKKMSLGSKASGGIAILYNFLAHTQPNNGSPWVIRYHVGIK